MHPENEAPRQELVIRGSVSLGSGVWHWGLLSDKAGVGVFLELVHTRPPSSSPLLHLIWVTVGLPQACGRALIL